MAERDPLQPASGSRLTVGVDELPRTGVRAFVSRLSESNHVVYERTRLDDWAEAVTQA